MKIVYALLAATCLLLGLAGTTKAAEPERNCPSREDVIGMIAHKADVQYAGSGLSKWTVWHIAERESGLQHCDIWGYTKISPSDDHGLIQLNPLGVYLNCSINLYCNRPDKLDDPEVQVDIIFNYWLKYGDLCPWNPDQIRPNYMPGWRVSRPVLGEHMSQEQSWLDSFDDREKKELDFCTWLENENYLIDASISFYLERNVICWLIYSLDKNTPDKNWLKMIDGFDDGCVEIIRIARWYARNAHHGTAGHNLYMLIAKLADLLDEREHDAVHSS